MKIFVFEGPLATERFLRGGWRHYLVIYGSQRKTFVSQDGQTIVRALGATFFREGEWEDKGKATQPGCFPCPRAEILGELYCESQGVFL